MDKFTETHLDNWLEKQFPYDEDRQIIARELIKKKVAEDEAYMLELGWNKVLKLTNFWDFQQCEEEN